MMQGYKTFLVGLLSLIGGMATMMGVTLEPDTLAKIQEHAEVVIGGGMALYGLVMLVLRKFTASPMFKKTVE